MSDAITLTVSPAALTDEQLSDALSLALAADEVRSTATLLHAGAYLDLPERVAGLLAEYKRRHVRLHEAGRRAARKHEGVR